MPVSPSEFEEYAAEIRRAYEHIETAILQIIAERAAKEPDTGDPQWLQDKLELVRLLRIEVEQELKQAEAVIKAGEDAVKNAYDYGSWVAEEDIAALREQVKGGQMPTTARFGMISRATVETLVGAAVGRLSTAHLMILRASEDAYRDVIYKTSLLVTSGVLTYQQAAQKALNDLADQGIKVFTDKAGRRWDLASYTEMAVRSALAQSSVQGFIDTALSMGHDLVQGSDSPEECPLCRPWEQAVLSITGQNVGKRFKTGDGRTVVVKASVAEAIAAGFLHPNCTHNLGIFVPGLSKAPEPRANPEGYEERLEQRYIERQIRRWKRRAAVAQTDEELRHANAKVKEWQAKMREFIQKTGRQRQYWRESITWRTPGAGTGRRGRRTPPKAPDLSPPPPPVWKKPFNTTGPVTEAYLKETEQKLHRLHERFGALPKKSSSSFEENRVRRVIQDLTERMTAEEQERLRQLGSYLRQKAPEVLQNAGKGFMEDDLKTAVFALVETWNMTSGDSNPLSVALQLAAQAEWGLDDAFMGHIARETIERARREYGDWMDEIRLVLRKQYEYTQDVLKQEGLDEVLVYRGIGWHEWEEVPEDLRNRLTWDPTKPGVVDLRMQPLASFTTSSDRGTQFGQKLHGMTIAARVPRERVVSISTTGMGTGYEREVVVMGGGVEQVWYVSQTKADPRFRSARVRKGIVKASQQAAKEAGNSGVGDR